MSEKEKYITRLRELADFFETASDDLPRPTIHEVVYIGKDSIPTIIRNCRKLSKVVQNGYFSLVKDLDHGKLLFRIAQEEVCERKVVGQTWVEEYTAPAHFVDQVEYECKPILNQVVDGEPGER